MDSGGAGMNRPSYKELWLYERKDRDEQLQWIRDAVDGNAKFRNSEPPYSEEEELARQVMTMHTRCAELEAAQHWIPVEERLPENKFEKVLVCTTYGVSVRLALEIGEAVTHWMPLPEPPIDQLTAYSDIERQDDKWIPEVK